MLACPETPIGPNLGLARPPQAHPREIGGYRILRPIAQGSSATIYLAQDRRNREPIALKVLNQPRQDARQAASRFAGECALLSAVRDEHVVRVVEQRVLRDPPYLAMEYVGGGTLRQQMGAPMEDAAAVSLARQAALGLAAVHRRGIVHRDVKPENMLVRSCGTLVLADFGVAARRGDRAARVAAGRLVGTLCYAAPEQLQGEAPEPSADVYSLGVILYEMLCGRPPFGGGTALEMLAQHLVAPVPQLPAGVSRYQALIDAMLDKQARRRPADAGAVLDEIRRLAPDGLRRN